MLTSLFPLRTPTRPRSCLSPQPAALATMSMTGRSKAKNQITYLAFQAVAKEKEIRERQARGILSRRETQAKYGF